MMSSPQKVRSAMSDEQRKIRAIWSVLKTNIKVSINRAMHDDFILNNHRGNICSNGPAVKVMSATYRH